MSAGLLISALLALILLANILAVYFICQEIQHQTRMLEEAVRNQTEILSVWLRGRGAP